MTRIGARPAESAGWLRAILADSAVRAPMSLVLGKERKPRARQRVAIERFERFDFLHGHAWGIISPVENLALQFRVLLKDFNGPLLRGCLVGSLDKDMRVKT